MSQSDLVISVNSAKFELATRNECLVTFVQSRIGKVTAGIYRKILAKVERRLLECRLEKNEDENARKLLYSTCTITTRDIADMTPEHEDLRSSVGAAAEHEVNEDIIEHPKKKRRKEVENSSGEVTENEATNQSRHIPEEEDEIMTNGIDTQIPPYEKGSPNSIPGNGDVGLGQSNLRPQKLPRHTHEVRSHLLLLAHHPMKFLDPAEEGLHLAESWVVKFPHLVESLQRQEITQIILAKYGTKPMRLMNILVEHGKLDDKTLASLSMIREKDLRPMLTTMHQAGLLELQEVPRDNARLASRTTFLFFFDQDRCRRNLLEDCYKTMANLLQRMKFERTKTQAAIDKHDRNVAMTRDEKQDLWEWQKLEEKLWGQVMRIDDTVALLRDY